MFYVDFGSYLLWRSDVLCGLWSYLLWRSSDTDTVCGHSPFVQWVCDPVSHRAFGAMGGFPRPPRSGGR